MSDDKGKYPDEIRMYRDGVLIYGGPVHMKLLSSDDSERGRRTITVSGYSTADGPLHSNAWTFNADNPLGGCGETRQWTLYKCAKCGQPGGRMAQEADGDSYCWACVGKMFDRLEKAEAQILDQGGSITNLVSGGLGSMADIQRLEARADALEQESKSREEHLATLFKGATDDVRRIELLERESADLHDQTVALEAAMGNLNTAWKPKSDEHPVYDRDPTLQADLDQAIAEARAEDSPATAVAAPTTPDDRQALKDVLDKTAPATAVGVSAMSKPFNGHAPCALCDKEGAPVEMDAHLGVRVCKACRSCEPPEPKPRKFALADESLPPVAPGSEAFQEGEGWVTFYFPSGRYINLVHEGRGCYTPSRDTRRHIAAVAIEEWADVETRAGSCENCAARSEKPCGGCWSDTLRRRTRWVAAPDYLFDGDVRAARELWRVWRDQGGMSS